MRKAVGLALDGQSTTRVAQEFGIPARTLRRYVATAKKANGLPETAATDRPTHAPSKKKKSASLKAESGFVRLWSSIVWPTRCDCRVSSVWGIDHSRPRVLPSHCVYFRPTCTDFSAV